MSAKALFIRLIVPAVALCALLLFLSLYMIYRKSQSTTVPPMPTKTVSWTISSRTESDIPWLNTSSEEYVILDDDVLFRIKIGDSEAFDFTASNVFAHRLNGRLKEVGVRTPAMDPLSTVHAATREVNRFGLGYGQREAGSADQIALWATQVKKGTWGNAPVLIGMAPLGDVEVSVKITSSFDKNVPGTLSITFCWYE